MGARLTVETSAARLVGRLSRAAGRGGGTTLPGKLLWKVSDNLGGLKLSKTIYGPKDASGRREEILHAGKKVTPGIFDVMLLLGPERTIRRLRDAADRLEATSPARAG